MDLRLLGLLRCPLSRQRLALESFESDQTQVVYGLLSSDAGCFPILDGIPVLMPDQQPIVELLVAGRLHDAVALAAFGSIDRTRYDRVIASVTGAGPVGRVARQLGNRARERRFDRWRQVLFTSTGYARAAEVIKFAYLESSTPMPDAYNYFVYRYSMPRHLVGLACIEWARDAADPVLDLGCGAGHLTWAWAQRRSFVVGVDKCLFLLLAARRQLAQRVDLVCSDCRPIPFQDGCFGAVIASDVMSFVTRKWPVASDACRVLKDGGRLAMTSVKNSLCDHVYAGQPLTPDGWRLLAGQLEHRLLPDSHILANYLAGRGLPGEAEPGAETLVTSPTLTLLASSDGRALVNDGKFDGWPHLSGELGVNPLFGLSSQTEDALTYERRFPSQNYLNDNPEMSGYLPNRFTVSRVAIAEAGNGHLVAELEPLVAKLAILGFPPGYLDDPWPGTAL
ncbi:MAG: methyltransferase domain-containing protein [Actinomycetota bacterium]